MCAAHFLSYLIYLPIGYGLTIYIDDQAQDGAPDGDLNFVKKLTVRLAQPYAIFIGVTSLLLIFEPMLKSCGHWCTKRHLKSDLSGDSATLLKYEVQADVDNKYSRPGYEVERRAAQHFTMALACFVYSTLYPFLAVGMFVICLAFYYSECYTIAKGVFLRKPED